MRRLFFWGHLLTGVTVGVIILSMAVTGGLLVFMPELTTWVDTHNFSAVQKSGAMLPAQEIAQRAMANIQPDGRLTIVFRSGTHPAEVSVGNQTVYVDPYSGALLGQSSPGMRVFSEKVRSFHTSLGALASFRRTGKVVVDTCNVAFFFMALSGLYMWFPRKWNWASLRSSLLFRGGLAGRAKHWNWHNVAGIWCVVPLIFITLTGMVMSYDWATNLAIIIGGGQIPVRTAGRFPGGRGPNGGARGPFGQQALLPGDLSGLDTLVDAAKAQTPGWTTISSSVGPGGQLRATAERSGWLHPLQRFQFTLDPQSGNVVMAKDNFGFSGPNAPKFDLAGYLRIVHTGEAGAIPGKILALIACLGALLLIYTGYLMSLRRYLNWRVRSSVSKVIEPKIQSAEHVLNN